MYGHHAETPQRRRAEFVRSGLALRYAVRQPWPHMMNGKIGEKIGHFPAQCGYRRVPARQRRGVAQSASGLIESR